MKITQEWLESKNACSPSLKHVIKNNYIGLKIKDFISKLMSENRFSDANWLIVRCMDKSQNVKYAIFAAEQVLHIFEAKYPDDKRPRSAIEAAKRYLENPCKETRGAADAAYAAAYAAADAAAGAGAAAGAAGTYAADAADAAYAAYAAAAYAAAAAYTADADAAYAADARKKVQTKILNYGLTLI